MFKKKLKMWRNLQEEVVDQNAPKQPLKMGNETAYGKWFLVLDHKEYM